MCGIAGLYSTTGWDLEPRMALERMLTSIHHRGPDGMGTYWDGPVGLGHVRLSIIDLAGGHQPMADSSNKYWVSFNGEIFNYVELRASLQAAGHQFHTNSDTEVILEAYKAYGNACVNYFNGDFAFALWDSKHQTLFLARDRLGVRPIYYRWHQGILAFASEVKALFQVPGVRAELDPVALQQCLTFWHPLAPRTPWKGIKEVPPGHMMVFRNNRLDVRPYWTPSYAWNGEATTRPEADLAEELHALLLDATMIRLRADVPVGAYLSGGLDSSITAALIKQVAPGRLRTFSVGFETAEFDERAQQAEMVRALGCDHSGIVVRDTDIATNFPAVLYHTERPILRTAPAPLYKLAQLVRQNNYKVVLTGEGADEVFGGYDIFKEAKVRRFWARQPASKWRSTLLHRLYPYLPGMQSQPLPYLEAFFKIGLDRPNDLFFSHRPRWVTTAGVAKFLSDDLLSTINGYDPVEDLQASLPTDYPNWGGLARAQYLETAQLLPGYILSAQGDRVAMAHAVEGRFPFLDHRVAEFAAQLPPRLKVRGLVEKYILRRAMQRDLPVSIAQRPKQPYRAPDAQCFFAGVAPAYVRELLEPAAIKVAGYFDHRSVSKLVQKCSGGTVSTRDNMALVAILSTQLLDHLFVRNSDRNTCDE